MKPSDIKKGLLKIGYSEDSANFLSAQYAYYPKDSRHWGTEEQTRKDIKTILTGIKTK